MPSPKTCGTSDLYDSTHNLSNDFDETNDCVVKALSIACDISYAGAHGACRRAGRPARKGMHKADWMPLYAEFGKKLVRVDPQFFICRYPGIHDTLKNVTTHHPERFNKVWDDGKTYLILTRAHVGVVINGRNHDWTVGRAKRAVAIYEVVDA